MNVGHDLKAHGAGFKADDADSNCLQSTWVLIWFHGSKWSYIAWKLLWCTSKHGCTLLLAFACDWKCQRQIQHCMGGIQPYKKLIGLLAKQLIGFRRTLPLSGCCKYKVVVGNIAGTFLVLSFLAAKISGIFQTLLGVNLHADGIVSGLVVHTQDHLGTSPSTWTRNLDAMGFVLFWLWAWSWVLGSLVIKCLLVQSCKQLKTKIK